MECGVIYKLVEPFQSFVFGNVKDYVGYIGSCTENLKKLRESLKILCNKKDDIRKRVKDGNDKLEEVTREAGHWLDDVQRLAMDKALKDLMYKDIEIGKFVVKLMEKSNLKWCLKNESEMQELVINVMRKLKEEMEVREEDEVRRMIEVDYKNVGEVLVEVMKDTLDDFKKVIKEDKKMAVIAKRILVKEDLDKLTKDDPELEDIFRKVANASDEESRPNHDDEEPNAPLLQSPVVGVKEDSTLTDKAKELFKPLSSLLTPLKKLLSDAKFKKAVRGADGVKLGLEVIDVVLVKSPGLKRDMRNNAEQRHRSCCCCSSLSLCDYHGDFQISKAAESVAKRIQDEISKCPPDRVTSPISSADLKLLPSQFLKSLVSRTTLLRQILEYLKDDQVKMVGVFGMGGAGKTTMAKEVNNELKEIFNIKVMVEVSDTPDIMRIQAAIGESIGLPLHEVKNIGQRAVRIFNRLSSEKKALIILDNIWKKLNLDEIGIPNTCKLLLTTREKDVCRVMGVSDVNIVEVRLINANEARELFKRHAGVQVDVGDFNQVVERLLSKCRGLPLSLVATGNALKGQDLSSWEKFAEDLEKPISSQLVAGDYRHAYLILNTSYRFIESKEKKIFFLLACLSPSGSNVSIENLMRNGIALNLFQHVDKLCEAMEQANTWISELLSSSMLLEGDVEGCVKIHDIVRSFGISFAAKEERHKFMVEHIPRWLDDETLKMYSAILLMSKNDFSRLSGVKAHKLRILVLTDRAHTDDFFFTGMVNLDDLFFTGMVNLEVLVLLEMNFKPKLPESIEKLKKLRTLRMERCMLGDIKQVGKLVNLLVLSLRGSSIYQLPTEIGELSKLRLLDLNYCNHLDSIPPGILGRLSKLEGLYLCYKKQMPWFEGINGGDNMLPYLNAFETDVSVINELPVDGQSLQNLERFRVRIGSYCERRRVGRKESPDFGSMESQGYCRVLHLIHNIIVNEEFVKKGINVLLNKADKLSIGYERFYEDEDEDEDEDLISLIDQEGGFRDLKYLRIQYFNAKCILKRSAMKNVLVFPSLRVLSLRAMALLEVVYDGEAPLELFSSLQTLSFVSLCKLLYGLPSVPRNLEVIEMAECPVLQFIFLEDEEPQIMELPFLRKLELIGMPCLSSLVGPKTFSDTCEVLEANGIFFDGKIRFSSLESLDLMDCGSVVELWGKGVCHSGFQNLKDVCIQWCESLSSIGSSSLFSDFVQLETFRIISCVALREVIHSEETNGFDTSGQLIKFHRLKCLDLTELDTLETFCSGGSTAEFPKLKKLILSSLPCMNNFLKSENPKAFFHGKTRFSSLESLDLMYCGSVVELWGKGVCHSGFQNLKDVRIESCESLSSIGSRSLVSDLVQLETFRIIDCVALREVIYSEETNGFDTSGQLIKFHRLKCLELSCLNTLETFCSGGSTPEFPKLKNLILFRLPCMNNFLKSENPEAFFHGKIRFSSLESVNLMYCGSVVGLWGKGICHSGFQNLKDVRIESCESLSSIGSCSLFSDLVQLETLCIIKCVALREVIHSEETNGLDTSGQLIKFRCLKCLELTGLNTLETFCSGGSTPEFPKLKKLKLSRLPCMNNFLKSENPEAFFHGKIKFPCLEELEVRDLGDEVMGLWDWQMLSTEKGSSVSNPVPMLRWFWLGISAGAQQIPFVIFEKLSQLVLVNFSDADVATFYGREKFRILRT